MDRVLVKGVAAHPSMSGYFVSSAFARSAGSLGSLPLIAAVPRVIPSTAANRSNTKAATINETQHKRLFCFLDSL